MKIRQHRDDQQTYELYTERESIMGKKSIIIWAILHEDFLMELGLTQEDIENCDYKLEAIADIDSMMPKKPRVTV